MDQELIGKVGTTAFWMAMLWFLLVAVPYYLLVLSGTAPRVAVRVGYVFFWLALVGYLALFSPYRDLFVRGGRPGTWFPVLGLAALFMIGLQFFSYRRKPKGA